MAIKLRRSLLAAGVPVAAGLSLAGTALASRSAPAVSVRVEGTTSTLLQTKTVTAPTAGSIAKGGTPTGTCPADSAAGALNTATHGRWSGSYYKGLGIDISTILGKTFSYTKGSYWAFYVNDRLASKGVCDTSLVKGDSLLFAPVPAKGKTPLPIVVRAPKTVTAGKSFDVRAFVYTGTGNATKPVRGARAQWTYGATTGASKPELMESKSAPKGEMRFIFSGVRSARTTLVISAKGEIRSAATEIKVVN